MRITLIFIGKTETPFFTEGINEYLRRIKYYANLTVKNIQTSKNARKTSAENQRKKEGELILSKVPKSSELHLFDETGKMYSSKEFASFIEKRMVSGLKELIFVVGGPYGFSPEVYKRANSTVSLSRMTFSHQMARILCTEQIYRAYTIINGEPYHHD